MVKCYKCGSFDNFEALDENSIPVLQCMVCGTRWVKNSV